MKTTGVVPEAFAASISLLSRSEMDVMPTPSGPVKSIQPYRCTTVREKVLESSDFAPRIGRSMLPRIGDLSRRAIRHVSRLSVEERRDLLRDLTAPSIIRADAIRQFRERPDGQRTAEVLKDLESDEPLRLHVVDALRRSLASPGGQQER